MSDENIQRAANLFGCAGALLLIVGALGLTSTIVALSVWLWMLVLG